MKKVVSVMLAFVMVAALLCGCGNANTASDAAAPKAEEVAAADAQTGSEDTAASGKKYDGVELTYWTAPMTGEDDKEMQLWAEWLGEFEEETGATVNVEIVPWEDMDTKLMTGVMSNDCADVMYLGGDDTYGLAKAGALLDLSTVFTDEEIADELYWDMMAIEGEHCMVGYVGGTSVRGIVYNKDIFEQAGVEKCPETWDDLLDAGKKVKAACPDVYPYLFSLGGDANGFIYGLASFMYQAGGGIIAGSDGYTFDTPEGIKAATYFKQLVDEEIIPQECLGISNNLECIDLFSEGKVAMMILSAPEVLSDERVSAVNWGFGAMTHDVAYGAYNPIDPIAVWSGTENVEAATDLLRFLRSGEMIQRFRDSFWDTAAMKASAPYTPDLPGTEAAFEHPEGCFGLVFAPGYSEVQESAIKNSQLIVMGEITPEEAMAQIQADADKAYSEN